MTHSSVAPTAPPVAIQLWTIRDAIAVDGDRALARGRAAGFEAVELAPLPPGLDPSRFAESLAAHDLAVHSVHCDLPEPETIDGIARAARACRCAKIIWHGWPRDPRFDSPARVRDLAAVCNAAATLARDRGLAFGVHNHWWEFEPVAGDRPVRILHEALSPDVFWQLDVYWARTAGADPAGVAAELGPRVRSVHWKDGPCVHGRPMTALGQGQVDVPRILRALTGPVDSVIELDECATDPLEAARQGRVYLESLRG
jgi:sugar phosphate isomerase/epimerase